MASTFKPAGAVQVQRVRKAYEQVADQLRELIVSGQVLPGHRLPNEAALSTQFGVSRATVREALRVLSTLSLIRTTKGPTGGSYVILPNADHISEFLTSNISLLSHAESISLDDFLELRKILEVPAARLAAKRHGAILAPRLDVAIPERPHELGIEEQFLHNKDFHFAVVQAADNTLLTIAAQPIFLAMQSSLQRPILGRRFHQQVNEDHRRIAAAIAAGDEDLAGEEMERHLEALRPGYTRAWRRRPAGTSSPD
jgi:GntR family transcriptional repressor for pyruvate dehydrogenase complex